ncbi:MAG: VanZ family protein [Candidatus Woesebacteria bacterium]
MNTSPTQQNQTALNQNISVTAHYLRMLSAGILLAYAALLIKIMVYKDIPTIHIGSLMLNFGGTDASHPANFIPFRTIGPYLFGDKGLIIAGINLVGNIALLIPVGFFAPFVFPTLTWKKSLILAIASGLAIEGLQTLLHVGIFDIDDVMLNALGVMLGYFAATILITWIHKGKYKNILVSTALGIAALAVVYGTVVYPLAHMQHNPGVDVGSGQMNAGETSQEGVVPQNRDLCNGTGGTGQIITVGENRITIQSRKGSNQTITLTDQTLIKTASGGASKSDLKPGEHVTVVIDDTETASTVLVCTVQSTDTQSGE